MAIYAVLALSDNHVIGKDNKLPWHIPNDLRWFKMNTYKKTIVMGYNTWRSLKGKRLPDRHTIVMSRRDLKDVECFGSFRSLFMKYPSRDLYIIGGAKLIKSVQEFIDIWILTHVHTSIRGDCYFCPPYHRLKAVYESPMLTNEKNGVSYHHAIYKRVI